jgi:MFS family permease
MMVAIEGGFEESAASEAASRRTLAFINIAHALDHFVMLIYPTAIIAIAATSGLAYSELIALATGAFVAFGALSLPVGFLARRLGRRNMLAGFYFGVAFACAGMATAQSPLGFTLWLLLLGSFSAIYHPVGSSMLVANTTKLGRSLGVNGVWGNMGAALASAVTAWLAAAFGWQAAFLVPAAVAAGAGALFLMQVPSELGRESAAKKAVSATVPQVNRAVLVGLFVLGVACAGVTFNTLTIAMPKVIDERLGLDLPLGLTGSLATAVFVIGALTQLSVGRLLDRIPLPALYACIALFQPLGFALASATTGAPLLLGLLFAIAAIYGNVVVMDAMVARYVPDRYRSQAYGLRYFLAFAASGFAVPLIAFLHDRGGFPAVLAVAGSFAFALFLSALMLWRLMGAQRTFRPEGA